MNKFGGEIKPGIRAMIIGSKACPSNIGKVVDVVRLCPKGINVNEVAEYHHLGLNPSEDCWLVHGEDLVIKATKINKEWTGEWAICLEKNLMPLDADDDLKKNETRRMMLDMVREHEKSDSLKFKPPSTYNCKCVTRPIHIPFKKLGDK